jgi:hypothetical protein
VLPILMAIGLGEGRGRLRLLCFLGAGSIAIVLPMSGARSPALLVGLSVLAIFWSAGALATRKGWVIMAASALFTLLPLVVSPDAVQGVRARFEYSDTAGRFNELLQLLPPYAILENQYPLMGIGTGMQHNLRFPLGIRTDWVSEGEMGRFLIELGVVGYLLMWTLRLGLVLALMRAARLLRRHQRRPLAGLCYAMAGLTVFGSLVFDHVWQALYFTAIGLILQSVAPLWQRERAARGRGPRAALQHP